MKKIAIVVAEFNESLTKKMQETAEAEIRKNNAEISEIISVPGAFEIPYAVSKAIENADAVVTLGVVIQGKTDHDVVIVNAIAPKLIDISIQHKKPIGFGVIGPRVSKQEAEDRVEEYARRAVLTVTKVLEF